MNSQLLLAVSQVHQEELRQAAREARLASRPRSRARFAVSRRFRISTRTGRPAPVIPAQARTV